MTKFKYQETFAEELGAKWIAGDRDHRHQHPQPEKQSTGIVHLSVHYVMA